MNMSTISKQLSTTNSAAPTKGTTAKNTTTVTPLSSQVTSTNASASPRANDFGMPSLVKPSGLTVKYDSGEGSRDVLLSPGTVAVIAFAITAAAVVFIFLILGIRRKRREHHNQNERSWANSFHQVAFRTTPRYVAGDSNLLAFKLDDSITFQPVFHPDDGADKCDTVPLQGDGTALSSAIAADADVYGSQRKLEQGENHPIPTSPEVTDAEEESRRRHQGAGANDENTASHFNDI